MVVAKPEFRLVFILLTIASLSGCNFGPDPDDEMIKKLNEYYPTLATEHWQFAGLMPSHSDRKLTVNFKLIKPFDEEYVKRADWQRRSDALHYCLRRTQQAEMNLRDWHLTIVTSGETMGKFVEIVCGDSSAIHHPTES